MTIAPAALAVTFAALAGCAAVAPTLAPDHPGVRLDFAGAEDPDPAVAASCERSLIASLERRGFVLGHSGPSLRVHISFWDQPSLSNTSEGLVTADFAGTSPELLPRHRVVTASSTGTSAGATGGLSWQPARARIATCAYGSERFAEVLVATLYPPR
jgi:hypothetical protein